jgi:protein transport protein SEC9
LTSLKDILFVQTTKQTSSRKLNRSIFRPAITFNKDAKRAAQEAKLQSRYDGEREEREKAMMDIRETHNRLGQAATYGRGGDDDEEGVGGPGAGRGRYRTEQQLAERKAGRQRFQFEATGSDDELEDELDGNLDEMSSGLKSLKALSLAMGQELGEQNTRIGRIEQKTVGLDDRLGRNTERVCSDFILLDFNPHMSFSCSSRRSSDLVWW